MPKGRTVNKQYELEVRRRFLEANRQKRTELWKNQSWILHDDKAPALTHQCLYVSYWPYSLNLPSAEFVPQGNKQYELKVRRRFREAIRQQRTELWKNQSWILHDNKSQANTSMVVRELLAVFTKLGLR